MTASPPEPPPSRRRRALAVGAWLGLLTGAVFILHATAGVLPAPPLGSPSRWPQWAAGRDPVVIAFAVVRLLALAAGWYGLIVTVVGMGLRLASARRLSLVVDRLTVVPLRRLVAATVAMGVSAGPLTAAGASTLAATTSVPVSTPAPAAGPPVTVTMHLVAPGAEPLPTTVAPAPEPPSAPQVSTPVAPPDPEASDESPPATWTVRPGQSFWSIADLVLAQAWGRMPTDAEIVPYWRMLIEANRADLSDPHNPDLVFPGQVFSLPEV